MTERSRSGKTAWDKEKTRELFRRYKETGDPDAREQLVMSHMNLVRFLANKFKNRGEPLDDLQPRRLGGDQGQAVGAHEEGPRAGKDGVPGLGRLGQAARERGVPTVTAFLGPETAAAVTRAVRAVTKKPIIMKLSPAAADAAQQLSGGIEPARAKAPGHTQPVQQPHAAIEHSDTDDPISHTVIIRSAIMPIRQLDLGLSREPRSPC